MVASHAQALAGALADGGWSHVFGLMGDGNMHLFLAMRHRGVSVVEVRHESAAVAMAEGYTYTSGRVGVCSVTHGPGLSHVATSLLVAARNRSPLVLIAAETPAGYRGAQAFDQAAFVTSCEVVYRRMAVGEDPAGVLMEILALARDRSAPVVLGVAADLLTSPVPSAPRPAPRPRAVPRPEAPDDMSAARRLADLLALSERPVLIAGRGALGAGSVVRELADHVGAGLATTLPAKGLFDGHPHDLGIAGGLSHPAAERVLREADLIVGIGASLGRSTTQSGWLFASAHVVKLVDEPATSTVETLVGTPTGTGSRTLALVRDQMPTREPWFTPVGPSAACWEEDIRDVAPAIPAGTVDPRSALGAISEQIPANAVVIISNGHCSGFAATFITAPTRGQFFAAQGFGSIGQALPTAIGAALGAPGRKVVAFEGDAAFMMHAQEVDTAARAGADVTLFVLNDQALGTEYHRLLRAGQDADAAIVPPPDLAALAGALGARASTIDGPDFIPVVEKALLPGLAVVDVRTARSVLSRHMRGAAATAARA